MNTDERARIRGVLFFAGPQWGDRSVDDILKALDEAGYVIVPKVDLGALWLLSEAVNRIGNVSAETVEAGKAAAAGAQRLFPG